MEELHLEKGRSERLLYSMLPKSVAKSLKLGHVVSFKLFALFILIKISKKNRYYLKLTTSQQFISPISRVSQRFAALRHH